MAARYSPRTMLSLPTVSSAHIAGGARAGRRVTLASMRDQRPLPLTKGVGLDPPVVEFGRLLDNVHAGVLRQKLPSSKSKGMRGVCACGRARTILRWSHPG